MSDRFEKLPAESLDYEIDWTQWLKSDTIATSQWSAADGITVESSSNTTKTATIQVSGGSIGSSYDLVNTITTAGGRQTLRTITIDVVEKRACPADAAPMTDAELLAAIDAEIAGNPGGITSYKLKDGREVTRMSLRELLRARGMIEARQQRESEGLFAAAKVRRPC